MVGSHKTPNIYQNLSETPLNVPLNDQQHFNLNKVIEIKDFFVAEIKKKKELMSLVNISLLLTILTISSFSLAFSIFTGIVK